MMKLTLSFLITLLAATSISSASQPMQWTQTGMVSTALGSVWDTLGDGGVHPGTLFALTLIYDPNTPAFPAYSGSYPGAILSAALSLGNNSFQFDVGKPASSSRIDVIDSYTFVFNGAEGYYWFVNSSGAQNGLTNLSLEGHLFSSDASLFPSTDLDVQNLAISQFDEAHSVSFSGLDSAVGASQILDMTVTGYSVTPVPEPGGEAIFAAGVVGIVVARAKARFQRSR
jgi:hypothetical protein